MATTEERLDAAIDKYEDLFARMMHAADFIALQCDCPYDHAHHDIDEKRRAERMLDVSRGLKCPPDCYGDTPIECWRKWVLVAPADWWTV